MLYQIIGTVNLAITALMCMGSQIVWNTGKEIVAPLVPTKTLYNAWYLLYLRRMEASLLLIEEFLMIVVLSVVEELFQYDGYM